MKLMHIMSRQNGKPVGTGSSRRRRSIHPSTSRLLRNSKGRSASGPEHFLLAAVASCFIVTFYAMAAASKMEFVSLHLCVEGKLEKPEGKLRFTEIVLRPTLMIAYNDELEQAKRILEKAEEGCLMARSLACPVLMEPLVRPAEELLAR